MVEDKLKYKYLTFAMAKNSWKLTDVKYECKR